MAHREIALSITAPGSQAAAPGKIACPLALHACALSIAGFCPGYQYSRPPAAVLSPGTDLAAAVAQAPQGTSLLLEDGIYPVSQPLVFDKEGVGIRSRSGDREAVILDGNTGGGTLDPAAFVNELIAVRASDVLVADISLRHARHHAVHVSPKSGGPDLRGVHLRNLHVYDCGQQLIKVNSNGDPIPAWTDGGTLECSLVEFRDNSVMERQGDIYYTGGLDVHGGLDWAVRYNTFRGIERDGVLMEHAVHFWSRSRGTLVEGNRFENCYRGIGFGLKTAPEGLVRAYSDGAGESPYSDHIGGMIRNNTIFNAGGVHLESGIEIANALDVEIYHNTIVSTDEPFSSIEYRWPPTRVVAANNLASQSLVARDGAQAQLAGNREGIAPGWFVDYAAGDLHLSATATGLIDGGVVLDSGKAPLDQDGQARDAHPDIGADEFGNPAGIGLPRRASPRRDSPGARLHVFPFGPPPLGDRDLKGKRVWLAPIPLTD